MALNFLIQITDPRVKCECKNRCFDSNTSQFVFCVIGLLIKQLSNIVVNFYFNTFILIFSDGVFVREIFYFYLIYLCNIYAKKLVYRN